ncbi:MAG: UMP kinase [Bacteroidales bacterium]
MLKYNRILLKLSGEALMGDDEYGLNFGIINSYVAQVKEVSELGVQVAIVIGGGNIFRGLEGASHGFDRVKGDSMGMLATIINSIALNGAFESIGQKSKVFTSFKIESIGERFTKEKVNSSLNKNEIAILAGGTGNPFFTTDTASALRAVEINAQVLLKGTRVDGIYTSDPEKDKNAVKFDKISFDEVYERKLKIMDLTAFTMCKENNMPVLVFNMNETGNLRRIVTGDNIGTLVYI